MLSFSPRPTSTAKAAYDTLLVREQYYAKGDVGGHLL